MEQELNIPTRFKATFRGYTLGWYDTLEDAEAAIEDARAAEDHEGGFRVEGRAPDGLVFSDPRGRELSACSVPVEGDSFELIRHNRELGLAIDPDTGQTCWQGEPMDYDWAVASLMRKRTG